MRTKEKLKNFILYFLIIALVAAGSKARLDVVQQASISLRSGKEAVLTGASASAKVDCLAGHIKGEQTGVSAVDNLHSDRTDFLEYGELFFILCTLAVLSVLFQCHRGVLILHDSRSIYETKYIIGFMQDMDGRKKYA